jgi:hypothetical protein
MIQGLQNPYINFTMDNNSIQLRMPYQNTPLDVYKYLREMDFVHTTSSSGDMWMRKGTSEYFTWEQAVAYCLIKPFLNP